MRLYAVSIAFLICIGCTESTSDRTDRPPKKSGIRKVLPPPKGPTVQCPVCSLTFNAQETTETYTHEGTRYYFLLKDHKEAFRLDPESYLKTQ